MTVLIQTLCSTVPLRTEIIFLDIQTVSADVSTLLILRIRASAANTEERILPKRKAQLTISDKPFKNHQCSWLSILVAHQNQLGELFKINAQGTFQAVQWLRLHLPMQGVRVRSLVWKLRSHMPCDHKTKTLKNNRSNSVTNSISTFKMVHIKKKNFLKIKLKKLMSRDSVPLVSLGQSQTTCTLKIPLR